MDFIIPVTTVGERGRGEETGGQGRAGTRRRGLWGQEGRLEELEGQSWGMGLLTQVAVTEVALQGACPPALFWAGDTGCIWGVGRGALFVESNLPSR